MIAWVPGRRATVQRIARWGLACVCLILVSAQAAAARVAVVLSKDSAPYQEVYQVVRTLLDDSPHELSRVYADKLTASTLEGVSLVVAVGVRAGDALALLEDRPPVLAVLVPRAWYVRSGRSSLGVSSHASAIYLDQPFERQARLIHLAFPDAHQVGVLLSDDQGDLVGELDAALRGQQLGLLPGILASDERLIGTLENVLSEADLLLAVADPNVFNRNTAQSLFLTTYRYRVPVVGYSQSLTRAGALLSLHSSPAQIGRQTAEWVLGALQGASVRLPPPAYPAYFGVSVNEQVARSLGFALLPEAELEARLGGKR